MEWRQDNKNGQYESIDNLMVLNFYEQHVFCRLLHQLPASLLHVFFGAFVIMY